MKIHVAVPTYGLICAETVDCLLPSIISLLKDHEVRVQYPVGTILFDNRNNAVKKALENNMDYLMFIDSDMIFPEGAIQQLIADDKDIVAAKCNVRNTGDKVLHNVKFLEDNKILVKDTPNELFKCFAVGTGFMLIKMKVFKKMADPWFFHANYQGKMLGEDIFFCWQANNAGFEVWCDPTINMGHIGKYVY